MSVSTSCIISIKLWTFYSYFRYCHQSKFLELLRTLSAVFRLIKDRRVKLILKDLSQHQLLRIMTIPLLTMNPRKSVSVYGLFHLYVNLLVTQNFLHIKAFILACHCCDKFIQRIAGCACLESIFDWGFNFLFSVILLRSFHFFTLSKKFFRF